MIGMTSIMFPHKTLSSLKGVKNVPLKGVISKGVKNDPHKVINILNKVLNKQSYNISG